MIRLENLEKTYRGVQALDRVSLRVAEGEIFAYLGPNGAGKTTTIRILSGLTRPSGGRALVGGVDLAADPVGAKRQCGLAPQTVNLDQELTVAENLEVHGRLFGMSARDREERSAELLAYVEMEDKRHSLVKALSGGMKRRVLIARALLHRPRVLFLDEPSAGLDPAIRRRIWALLRQIQSDGTTIFLTTHYIEEAEFLAGRVAFLDRGQVVALDTPLALMDRLGAWALDSWADGDMRTAYFRDREEANAAARGSENGFTVRRVNLEDAFLARTGRKIA